VCLVATVPRSINSNLSGIEEALGNLPEAKRLRTRAIEIETKHFDADHPNLAIRYQGLGAVVLQQGDRVAALACMERAHEIFEKRLGPDHANTQYTRDAREQLRS